MLHSLINVFRSSFILTTEEVLLDWEERKKGMLLFLDVTNARNGWFIAVVTIPAMVRASLGAPLYRHVLCCAAQSMTLLCFAYLPASDLTPDTLVSLAANRILPMLISLLVSHVAIWRLVKPLWLRLIKKEIESKSNDDVYRSGGV